jgi:hypothetical protein
MPTRDLRGLGSPTTELDESPDIDGEKTDCILLLCLSELSEERGHTLIRLPALDASPEKAELKLEKLAFEDSVLSIGACCCAELLGFFIHEGRVHECIHHAMNHDDALRTKNTSSVGGGLPQHIEAYLKSQNI